MRVRAVLALLTERRAWGYVLAVLLACTLFVFLGRWQWHRHEAKAHVADLVHANYDAAVRPIDDLVGSADLPASAEWLPVSLSGSYLADLTVLARDRVQDGTNGYEVLVPVRTAAGRVLVVDRGWVPAGRTALGPRDVPAPPSGEVRLTVRVRPWQPPNDRRSPPGQTSRISRSALAGLTGVREADFYGGYAVLASEVPPPTSAVTPLDPPDVDLGPHLAYAVQWWAFAVLLAGFLVVAGDKEAQRRAGAGAPLRPTPTPDPESAPEEPVDATRRSRRWARLSGSGGTVDEEAEDAEVEGRLPNGGTKPSR